MPIPILERVQYANNTLEEVVCQLRFPPILKIASGPPVDFQELVRSDFPMFSEQAEASIAIPAGFPAELARIVPSTTSYEFCSSDGNWKLSLTREFVALTCDSYSRWEGFRDRLGIGIRALTKVYAPSFYSRIGLRYRNVIDRTRLGLRGCEWSELLKPVALGEIHVKEIAGEVEQFKRETLLKLEGRQAKVRVIQGLVVREGSPEPCFLIDCDYFTNNPVQSTDVDSTLSYLNAQSRNLFRFYIQEKLHNAMSPQSI